jgi:hypothetical protein
MERPADLSRKKQNTGLLEYDTVLERYIPLEVACFL